MASRTATKPWRSSVDVADIDGDGNQDIVAVSEGLTSNTDPDGAGVVAIFWGSGDGNVSTGPELAFGLAPTAVKALDGDNDRTVDIVTASATSHDISPLLGMETKPSSRRLRFAASRASLLKVAPLPGVGGPGLDLV